MKSINILALLLFTTVIAKSQITKRNWLVGGALSYSSSQSKGTDAINAKTQTLNTSANIGYFAIDKLAFGIVINSVLSKVKQPEINGTISTSTQNKNGFGPFLRYYFLQVEKRVNLLSEASFSYSILSVNNSGSVQDKFKTMDWNLFAGPVIYFNSSVGIEFMVGYNNSKAIDIDSKGQTIRFKIGLQIHLENE